MPLRWSPYLEQRAAWPATGRHILAQHDDETVVVYQAYRPEIADWAVAHGQLGGPWSFGRMSWIKPNFLWMMYRCGWARKEGQERVLAITLSREGFDTILAEAVASTHWPEVHGPDRAAWQQAGHHAGVRLQWDPDHAPTGNKEERRAVQLGLRGETLRRFAQEWTVHLEDITPQVVMQRAHATPHRYADLLTPAESVYPVADAATRARLRLDALA